MFWWHDDCDFPELLVTELVTYLFLMMLHVYCVTSCFQYEYECNFDIIVL
jgi:hypothetical protein